MLYFNLCIYWAEFTPELSYREQLFITFYLFQRLLANLRISDDQENADNLINMEKIVPLLQRLTDLYVTTASSTPGHEEAAKSVAQQMCHTYVLCHSLEQKRLLLTTVVSPLVKLNLVYFILDQHYGELLVINPL